MATKRGRSPMPVTVVGGFLGAGKTTLLNHILSTNHGLRAGVLVNDFGAVNIDAGLVVAVDGETVSLANGCVCCSIRDDLRSACLELLQRPEPPEHLFIEMSGVSNPVPVLETFLQPDLAQLFSLDCNLVVVDGESMPGMDGEAGRLARAQLETADIVILNKTDLLTPSARVEARAFVHEIVPGSRIFETSHGRVPLELIVGGWGPHREPARDGKTSGPSEHAHGHGHAHAHPFATFCWTSERPTSLPQLRALLEALPDTIYRAKGFIYLEELPDYRVLLQMVGKRHQLADIGLWGAETPRSEVVMIGIGGATDEQALRRALDECAGTGDEERSPILRLARKLGLSVPAA